MSHKIKQSVHTKIIFLIEICFELFQIFGDLKKLNYYEPNCWFSLSWTVKELSSSSYSFCAYSAKKSLGTDIKHSSSRGHDLDFLSYAQRELVPLVNLKTSCTWSSEEFFKPRGKYDYLSRKTCFTVSKSDFASAELLIRFSCHIFHGPFKTFRILSHTLKKLVVNFVPHHFEPLRIIC